jgi:uncharacterized protein YndB with AHSA1/START domain
MKNARYTFVTDWQLAAPVDKVWNLIYDSENWPRWWKGVERVEVLQRGPNGGAVGGVARYTWKSSLPYRLVFDMTTTEVIPYKLIKGDAHGELTGTGTWTFVAGDDGTSVRYVWDVVTTKAWMNVLAPLLRPAFNWNHDVVMAWGREGLEAELRRSAEK